MFPCGSTVAAMMGLSMEELLADQGAVNERYGKSHGQLLETIDGLCKKLIEMYLQGDGNKPDLTGSWGFSTAGYEEQARGHSGEGHGSAGPDGSLSGDRGLAERHGRRLYRGGTQRSHHPGP